MGWLLASGLLLLYSAGPTRTDPRGLGASGSTACLERLREAGLARGRGDEAAARVAIKEALSQGAKVPLATGCAGPAYRLLGDLELKAGALDRAEDAYRRAAHEANGDGKLWRLLTTARVNVLKTRGAKRQEAAVRELLDQEAKIRRYARNALVTKVALGTAERELDRARTAMEADQDRAHAWLAQAVRAKLVAYSGDAERGLSLAKPWLSPDRPPLIREPALEAAVRAAQVKQALPDEVRYALELNALRNIDLSPADRRFQRAPTLERTCARFEATTGPGRCALLAKQVTGEFSFRDWSKVSAKALKSGDAMEQAQAEYLPAVHDCVETIVKANKESTLFENARLSISYVVTAEGATREVEISPRRYDKVLGECVKERIGWFRYPRSADGQSRTVSVPYTLELVERFGSW